MNLVNVFRLGACFVLTAYVMLRCNSVNAPGVPSDLALVNGTLIDGTGGGPVPDGVVVMSEGMIVQAGSSEEIVIPPGVRQIDVNGGTILPGFINAHVHNGLSERNLEVWAQAGVTTVRDLCCPPQFSLRDEYAANPHFARLVAAGPMFSVPGGYPSVPWGSSCMMPVLSPADATTKVHQMLEDGADVIKMAVESGENFGISIPTLSHAEAASIVQAAHERGTRVSAHVLVASDLMRALAAGADDIAHMVFDDLTDAAVQQTVTAEVYWVPTIELWKNVGYGFGETAITNLARFVSAGGRVALGTDFDGYDRPFEAGMPISEMEWMREAGMSPMEIIVAGTRNAAFVCNRSHDLGTVEVGKIADVLVVDGDPLQDIRALLDVQLVIHNGVQIR